MRPGKAGDGPGGPPAWAREGSDEFAVRIDGTQPLSGSDIRAVNELCDRAEDRERDGVAALYVSGAPSALCQSELDIALVTRWERVLRRLERLAMTTVAVAVGECGGTALDAFLAADFRIATAGVRLSLPVAAGATWPGMAVYRLVRHAGAANVRRAVLFGVPIDAREALSFRLVDELVDDPSSALTTTAEMANPFSGAEIAIRRQLIADAATMSFDDALGPHLAACDRALRRASEQASS